MDTAKEYMQKAQEALAAAQAIQSIVDTAKANAEKCLADVEAVKESLAKMITYQGSVDNYSDLPTNPQVGYSYNVKNADKTHGVNAGDNVVWNGEDWDNFGGAIDMSLFAELGKDARFSTVTATTFNGDLNGTASTADAFSKTGNELGMLLWNMFHRYGINYVPSDTSNKGWNSLGLCIIHYNKYVINHQPYQYGQLINIPANTDNEATQIWIKQPEGIIYSRGGNSGIKINDTVFTKRG